MKADIDYNPKEKWVFEVVRFLTVDVQSDKFVCVLRCWAADGRSRLLHFTECYDINEVETLRKEWGVFPICVGMDTGHRTREVYGYILKYGYIGLKGVSEKRGFMKSYRDKHGRIKKSWEFYKKSEQAGDPALGTEFAGKGQKAPFYLIAVNPLKDILVRLRDGKGVEWTCLPEAQYDIQSYVKQLHSEYKKTVMNKYGGRDQFWVKIKSEVPNDLWDCEVYQIGLALMHPDVAINEVIASEVSPEQKNDA
jgi:hypothetical protein